MPKNTPKTTLYMLMSADGKISTGDIDSRDFDIDLKKVKGVKEGLYQYYDIEKTTDINSFNTGRVMAKIGVNTKKEPQIKSPCTFIIVDNKPHLTDKGVLYLTKWVKRLILVTTNKQHPAFMMRNLNNLEVVFHSKKVDLTRLFIDLKEKFKMKKITLQSGGSMNAELFRKGLIDRLSVVVVPCIVGGKDTPSLVDGLSLRKDSDLKYIKTLSLDKVQKLKNSYLHIIYKVVS